MSDKVLDKVLDKEEKRKEYFRNYYLQKKEKYKIYQSRRGRPKNITEPITITRFEEPIKLIFL